MPPAAAGAGPERGAFAVAAASSAELRTAEGRELLGLADLVSLNQDEAEHSADARSCPARLRPSSRRRAAVPARLVVTAGAAGAFGRTSAGTVHRVPGAAGTGREHRRRGRRRAGGSYRRRGGSAALPGVEPLPRGAPADSALDLGVCLAAYAVALAPHDSAGRGMGSSAHFVAPLGVRFGPSLERLAGVAA